MFLNNLKKLFYGIKILLISILDSFFIKSISLKNFNSIALVKVDNLGDFILWLPTAKSIRKYYGEKKITLICNQSFINLAEQLNLFDEIIGININLFNKDLIYRFRKIKQISKFSFYKVIHTTYSRDYYIGDSIVRVLNSQFKIGSRSDTFNQSRFHILISNLWYSHLIETGNTIQFEKFRNEKFLQKIGIEVVNTKYTLPPFEVINGDTLNYKNYILICPGATDSQRCWSPIKFTKLIDILCKKYSFNILLCGSIADKKQSNFIIKNCNTNRVKDLVGKTNIVELIELIRNANFIIGNDSAPIHISYTVNKPSICISGGNTFGRFVPYPNHLEFAPLTVFSDNCLSKNWNRTSIRKCIDEIDVQDVADIFIKSF